MHSSKWFYGIDPDSAVPISRETPPTPQSESLPESTRPSALLSQHKIDSGGQGDTRGYPDGGCGTQIPAP